MSEEEFEQLLPPKLNQQQSSYTTLVLQFNMTVEERLLLILALIPHIQPELLDILGTKNKLHDIPFTEFGGIPSDKYKGYLPTVATAVFILGGSNIEKRLRVLQLFHKDHFFQQEGILDLQQPSEATPLLNHVISLSNDYVSLLLTGTKREPAFNSYFPAKKITTTQEWNDLVVSEDVRAGILEIKDYLKHGKRLKNEYKFGSKIKPGFKVLFTGPPGTGKTLTVSLLGKTCGMDVYRVDLSMVVSKYIGETEKNLSRVFNVAENKNWILFFDEADALFGKRGATSDAHDRYANQGVSFLLQRIEDFDGLVILCSNFKKNIDEAFFRRFQLVLDFEMPDTHHRYILWQQSKTDDFTYHPNIDVEELAEQHELSAAAIINVLRYGILKSMSRNDHIINVEDIEAGLRIEKIKEGKSIV